MSTVASILLIMLIITTLSGQVENKSEVTVINLEKSFSNLQEVPLSLFVDDITYIPLETCPQAMIGGGIVNYEITDDYIIVRQYMERKYQIMLFDRKTGKFLREIGKNGRGPGEYSFFCFVPFNPVKKVLYAMSSSREILVYDVSGRNIDKIKMPEYEDQYGEVIPLGTKPILFENMLDDNVFVGQFYNLYGMEKYKLVLLSRESVLKIFPNFQSQNKQIKGIPVINRADTTFYKWDNKLYYLEAFCDTLYEVTKKSLIARYAFDLGKRKLSWTKLADGSFSDTRNFSFITDVDENKNYIFLKMRIASTGQFLGIIEKKTNILTFCKNNTWNDPGLKNDLRELLDVLHTDFTQKNEMVNIVQPLKLMSWLKENPEKAAL
jgi:hypothetical protein